MTVNKLTYPAKENAVQEKINEIIDNMAGTITVDQTYDGTSTNPQSGVAIAGAKFLQNTATDTSSLTINGTATSYSEAINIGFGSSVNANSIAIGYLSSSRGGAVALGRNTSATGTYSIAIGQGTKATAQCAYQIGLGTNSTAESLNVGFSSSKNYQLLDGTTGYIPNDRLIGLLETIYPIGALYIGTTSTCPLASLFGTWTLVAKDKALWTGDGTNADTTIPAAIPNIKGSATIGGVSGVSWPLAGSDYTGAITSSGVSTGSYANQTTSSANVGISIDASRYSSIYSDSVTTVQPPAYVVNVWKRTA